MPYCCMKLCIFESNADHFEGPAVPATIVKPEALIVGEAAGAADCVGAVLGAVLAFDVGEAAGDAPAFGVALDIGAAVGVPCGAKETDPLEHAASEASATKPPATKPRGVRLWAGDMKNSLPVSRR